MKTVLVTGSGGQLAKCITDLQPCCSDINFIFKSKLDLDVSNQLQVDNFFKGNQIDWCINCAAYTNVDLAEAETEKAILINEKGAENLAIICKENNVILIHISTDFVFDGKSEISYSEDNETNPINFYGLSKLKGEEKIKEIFSTYFIIRTSWLYSEHNSNFLKTMLLLSETKNEINVVNDQKGSPTYAKDLAEIIIYIIENDLDRYGTYHYSNSGKASWYDFAKEIFRLLGRDIKINPISSVEYKTAAKRPSFSVLNTSKIRSILGLEIPNWKISLKKAITIIDE